jgi:predicted AlkP superfamily phosphohydrolase/phosphomutase
MPANTLVLGLDALDPDLFDDWAEDLPTLAGIRSRGSAATLESTIPTATSVAWPSMMTGKQPAKHGVTHFTNEDDDVITRDSVKSRYVWELIEDAGLDVCVVGVPVTYPPDETSGVTVSGVLTPDGVDDWISPSDLAGSIPDPVFETGPADEDVLLDALDARLELTLTLLEQRDWDLFVTVFMETDRAGHSLLTPTADGIDGYDALKRVYQATDDAAGEIQSAANPRNTLVVSDHGFGRAPRKRINVTSWLVEEGFTDPPASTGSGLFTKERIERVLNDLNVVSYIPAPIRRFGREILPSERIDGNDTDDGADEDDADEDSERITYNGLWLHGGFDVDGPPELEQELLDRLDAATDPETGTKLFERVIRTRDEFDGPFLDRLPDVLVRFHPNYAGESYYRDVLVEPYPLSAVEMDHRYHGVLFAEGEDFTSTDRWLDGYHLCDFTPTLLHLFGLDVPEDCDGVVREELYAAGTDPATEAVSYGPPSQLDRERTTEGDYEGVTDHLSELGYLE